MARKKEPTKERKNERQQSDTITELPYIEREFANLTAFKNRPITLKEPENEEKVRRYASDSHTLLL